jgi:hypothetical protein
MPWPWNFPITQKDSHKGPELKLNNFEVNCMEKNEEFVMSLNTSALFHLGEISDPATGEKNQDLVLAKHTIDTLKLLEDKTKGNLNGEEQDLLKHVLYDLKMRYVAKADKNQ